MSEGRATSIPTIQEELRKNGSLPVRIETDDERSYFLIEITCREGFQNVIEPITQESKHKDGLKGELKTLRIILDLMIEYPEITTMALVERSGKSRSTVQKSIRILRNEHCIDIGGGKKYERWIVMI